MDILAVIIGVLIGAIIGAGAVYTWAAKIQANNQGLQRQLQAVSAGADSRVAEYKDLLADTRRDMERQRQGLESRMAHMSAVREKELQDRAREAQQTEAEQGQILAALAPVTSGLESLQNRIVALEEQRHEQFGTLSEQLKSAQTMERELQRTTQSLESALRNTSVRGSWGEAQLRNIVEASGLTEQVDFLTQTTISTEDVTLRPDMIIRMPGGKALPVDAKVPFASFIRASEIPEGGSAQQQTARRELMTKHVKALRSHVDALATKDYGRWVDGSPDFTIAFIPSESLLSAALEADPTLLDYAFRKRVALASPVTLWSVLKTVSFAWQQETLSKEAEEVFTLARELYSRLATMGGHARTLGQNLTKAVESYNAFVGSLERRVMVSARRFQALDGDTIIASLTPADATPRALTEPEFIDHSTDTPTPARVGTPEASISTRPLD